MRGIIAAVFATPAAAASVTYAYVYRSHPLNWGAVIEGVYCPVPDAIEIEIPDTSSIDGVTKAVAAVIQSRERPHHSG